MQKAELFQAFLDETQDIRALVTEWGGEVEAFERISQAACKLPGVQSAALYFFPTSAIAQDSMHLVACYGLPLPPEPLACRNSRGEVTEIQFSEPDQDKHPTYLRIAKESRCYGVLVMETSDSLNEDTIACLEHLAFIAGLIHENIAQREHLGHAYMRLEILSNLKQMVLSKTDLKNLLELLAREAAFRFSSHCALTLVNDEVTQQLLVFGCYGFNPEDLQASFSLNGTQLGRAATSGGILSIPCTIADRDRELRFFAKLGMRSIHIHGLQHKGTLLGAVLIGFRDKLTLDAETAGLLEEFDAGATVAIANARAHSQLAKHSETMEELVEERTKDLAVQTERADQANQAKSQFVANISHELRAPLTALLGYSKVLADRVLGEINPQQADALNAISRAAEHLRDLINDILDVSRIEAGKDRAEAQEVAIFPLVTQVVKLMMQSARGKEISIQAPKPAENEDEMMLRVWADPRHIRQVLINLISNAIKYTENGGNVSLQIEAQGDMLKVTVTDTGVGISEAEQRKIFDRYGRGEQTYSLQQTGTGLGLSLCKRLTEINGGKVGFSSTPGQGSDFWFLLPLASTGSTGAYRESIPSMTESLENVSRLDGLNILIVDDNQSTREVLQTIVQAVGATAYLAESVSEAKQIAAENVLDTALIDIAMPGESGIQLIDYFRRESHDRNQRTMPLIVVSACIFEGEKTEALEHGASTFVPKPFDPAELVATIRGHTSSAALVDI